MLLKVCRFKSIKFARKYRLKSAKTIFSANVRKFRRDKKISQEELAELAGLHRTYIGSVERGERNVSIDNMERIANALKVSVIDLLKEKPV
jgi:transcriptional regulator with XRE-family HTH domain